MDMKLTDKLALVSGSTAGIGYAIAVSLAGEGARVIVNGRSQEAVDRAIDGIRAETGRAAYGFAGDLSAGEVAEALVKAYPDIEILVNNLGIFEPKPFEDIVDADWMRFFEVNVLSGVRLARLCLPSMKRLNWGRIIFISSESAVQIPSEMIHYGMTKTAQLAVSRARRSVAERASPSTAFCLADRSRGVEDFVRRWPRRITNRLPSSASFSEKCAPAR